MNPMELREEQINAIAINLYEQGIEHVRAYFKNLEWKKTRNLNTSTAEYNTLQVIEAVAAMKAAEQLGEPICEKSHTLILPERPKFARLVIDDAQEIEKLEKMGLADNVGERGKNSAMSL